MGCFRSTRGRLFCRSHSRLSGDRQFTNEIKTRVEKRKAYAKAYEVMQKAKLVLDKTPHDPGANLTVGRYYCFMKGDWAKGLAMLAVSNDENLKPVALKDIAASPIARDHCPAFGRFVVGRGR